MEAINWDNGYPHYQAWVGCGRQYVEPALYAVAIGQALWYNV
ncbi:hypothetical protein FOQG_16834 [Fusarium oxysporum f. sp. raphani 54005]|uniref:Uncharacterized protein n=2 Tax=Fusarium oxysporum TaxID=5507 RepID=X0B9P0_FUSOX|nr:hypothetical protein FOVG_11171 [Fusarium oxysporum f. sp. pisi HDV247]EXK78486.1 hypothetical protein FOQG_16834 [Fusarium oxysporum f. sp. raphani 54005]